MNKNTKIKYQIIESTIVEISNKTHNEEVKKNLALCLDHLAKAYDGGQ